jgi:hypothetical protein
VLFVAATRSRTAASSRATARPRHARAALRALPREGPGARGRARVLPGDARGVRQRAVGDRRHAVGTSLVAT